MIDIVLGISGIWEYQVFESSGYLGGVKHDIWLWTRSGGYEVTWSCRRLLV